MNNLYILLLLSLSFGQFQPQTKAELEEAVDLWVDDNATALSTYGQINTWDVSFIEDMSYLFYNKTIFNDNISNWDVSGVTDMGYMFVDAESFNWDLSSWDVSACNAFYAIFAGANALSDQNKCAIHTAWSFNSAWGTTWTNYWSEFCVEGCADPSACNYDETATEDDGSCAYEVDECGVCGGDGSSCSGSAHLEIQNVNLTEGTLDIYMTNDVPVAGFQIKLSGIEISGAYGGSAESAGFWVDVAQGSQTGYGNVLGFSLEGITIPSGSGLLTTVVYSEYEDEICIELCDSGDWGEVDCSMLVDTNAEIPLTVGDCYENDDNWVYGCTYDTATNYNAEATFDDGSCDFMWGDVNHDGSLGIQDIIIIVNSILSGDWF